MSFALEWRWCQRRRFGVANLGVSFDTMLDDPGSYDRSVYMFPVMIEVGVGHARAFLEETDHPDRGIRRALLCRHSGCMNGKSRWFSCARMCRRRWTVRWRLKIHMSCFLAMP